MVVSGSKGSIRLNEEAVKAWEKRIKETEKRQEERRQSSSGSSSGSGASSSST